MNNQATGGFAAIVCLAISLAAAAQPDPNATGLKQNPQNVDAEAALRQAQQAGMQQATRMMRMTPQERQVEMQRILEQLLRTSLDAAGFKDKTLQETIMKFVADQEASRQAVRVAASRVQSAVEQGGAVAVNPATVATYIDDYLASVEDAKTARETATAALDKQINFSNIPRLRAWLLLNGLIGDAAWLTGNLAMMSTMTMSALSMVGPVKAATPAPAVTPPAR